MPMQINVTTQVNSKAIRRETYNGSEHWVVPSYTLPSNVVMNGGLYPETEINAHYQKLEGTLAPFGHPVLDGQFVSAFSPEGINKFSVGAWNRNVKKSGNRVYVEKWIDTEVAKLTENGRRLLERLEQIESGEDVPPIHTSVAVYLDRIEANEQQKKGGYDWIAKIHGMDHDAILLDEVGAATPEQGVGMMVNADKAQPLQANIGALSGESYRDKEESLSRAAKKRFINSTDDYVWVADFTDTEAVIIQNGGDAMVYSYTKEDGEIVFSDTGTTVERQTFWTPIVNMFSQFFNRQARPDTNQKEGAMPLTPEERAEIVKDVGEAVGNQLKPLSEEVSSLKSTVTTLQENHQQLSDNLTANQRAEEAKQREAVAKVHGEVVANQLSGEALNAMYESLGKPKPIGDNGVTTNADDSPDSLGSYLGEGK